MTWTFTSPPPPVDPKDRLLERFYWFTQDAKTYLGRLGTENPPQQDEVNETLHFAERLITAYEEAFQAVTIEYWVEDEDWRADQIDRVEALERAIREAPCPAHYQRGTDRCVCMCCDCDPGVKCNCWKREILKQ